MRKINDMLPMVMLTIIALYTNNLFAPYRPGKIQNTQQQRQQKQPQPAKSGEAALQQSAAVKTDTQKKKELAVVDKKINQSTKQLADAVKNKQKATTPEEEKKANKEIVESAKKVITFITHHRNLQGELLGYSKEEIEGADAIVNEMEDKQAALQGLVNKLKEDRKKLLVEGWKGQWLGSVKPGKETEYERITKKVNKLEPELAKLNVAVRNQQIVSGKQKFSKTRAFAATSLALAVGSAAAYTILGPIAIRSEYDQFKSNPREYLTSRASYFKSMVSNLLSSTATKEAITNAAGTALNDTWTRYILEKFSEGTLFIVNEALGITKSIIVGATIAPVIANTIKRLQEELEDLLRDDKSTQQQIEEKSQQIIDEGKKI